jgi:hypothetical protein
MSGAYISEEWWIITENIKKDYLSNYWDSEKPNKRLSFLHGRDILFIHSAVCLTTGPQSLSKRALHRLRSSASSSNFQYPLFSLRLETDYPVKVITWKFFHLLSTSQYSSRSNNSGHVYCYTTMNHFQHHLLFASIRYWSLCCRNQKNL